MFFIQHYSSDGVVMPANDMKKFFGFQICTSEARSSEEQE